MTRIRGGTDVGVALDCKILKYYFCGFSNIYDRAIFLLSLLLLSLSFHALIVSRILYAFPAFSGFLSEYNRSRINSVFRKGRK